jgi:hypothetical protein
MKRMLLCQLVLLSIVSSVALAIQSPTNLISLTGDKSVILHWDPIINGNLSGYRVYRSTTGAGGPFTLLNSSVLTSPGYCDVSSLVVNGQTNFYYATAVDTSSNESPPSISLSALPHLFATTNEFLDYVQQACFDFFWYAANPFNGLVPDSSSPGSDCSIAAVGFGLTAIGIGVDHGWITRSQAGARVLTTLNTFWQNPQGTNTSGTIGYQGWFYHFLNMNTALRTSDSNDELSSIDTAWLLTGVLYVKQYFNGTNATETLIRATADALFNRVNWTFMSRGTNSVAMGWLPQSGFTTFGKWVGYNEAMALYLLGLGTATNPLPASAWDVWTSGYTFGTFYGQTYVPFPPLFGHQYSECWIDYRFLADAYMNSHDLTYFENSRRAALAEVTYCSQFAPPQYNYTTTIWGLTACETPSGYGARGLPPQGIDDGTIAPTAAGGAIAFTPEYSVPSLMAFYNRFRTHIWTQYGYLDAFNLYDSWYAPDVLGIDQGPIVIMIENYRTQKVWQYFMANAEIQRGLQRAGFVTLPFMAVSTPQPLPAQGAISLSWTASSNRFYQVEYSPDLFTWQFSPGFVQATNDGVFTWLDTGPPVTVAAPFTVSQRFYRVFQMGPTNNPMLTPLAFGTRF